MESKNQKLLESFSTYCKENPEMRFWQALRNWAGVQIVSVVPDDTGEEWDTFYSDKQNGQ